jgi:hypothetical protein
VTPEIWQAEVQALRAQLQALYERMEAQDGLMQQWRSQDLAREDAARADHRAHEMRQRQRSLLIGVAAEVLSGRETDTQLAVRRAQEVVAAVDRALALEAAP